MSIDHEKERISAMNSYLIIDTSPEVEYDEITKLAMTACDTPISYISLVDHERAWFKSKLGFEKSQIPRVISACQFTIQQPNLLIIEDLTLDERTKFGPTVTGAPWFKFYAGMPLVTPDGYNIGSICVIDTKPRSLNENQKYLLKILAKQIMTNFELRKNNKNLKEMIEKTEKLSKSKEEFFSNMSHELRTPLNAISGFTDILSKSRLDGTQREVLGIIRSSLDILISVINDILDFSKIDSGNLKIEDHPFNIKTLIKSTYELLKLKAKEKGLSFLANIDKNIPSYINGDKVRLNQILVNLVGNAIKFTSKGGITLNIKKMDETETQAGLHFSVKDSGIGIPPENLKDIFQRFQQVEGTTRVFGGSGLGLSISKSLVELHNGKLEVKSELGTGSEFSFMIKYRKTTQEEISNFIKEEKSKECLSKPNFQNIKILLAEDNIINVKLIEKVFDCIGMQLETCENGKICIEKLKHNKYDLILMDMCMPEMDGCEATRYIRNKMKLDIPIIGLSANISEIDRRKCLDGGMSDYISKPFKTEELFQAINKIFRRGTQENKSLDSPQIHDKKHLSKSKVDSKFTTKYKLNRKSLQLNKSNLQQMFLKPLKPVNIMHKIPLKIKLKNSGFDINKNLRNISSLKNSRDSSIEYLAEKNFKGKSKFKPSSSEVFVQVDLDTINIKSLKEYSGDDENFEKELINTFLLQVPEYLKELDLAIISLNFKEIKNVAHKLKSPFGIFGLNNLRNKLEKMEEFCEKSQIIPIIKLFNYSKIDIDKVMIQLRDILRLYE